MCLSLSKNKMKNKRNKYKPKRSNSPRQHRPRQSSNMSSSRANNNNTVETKTNCDLPGFYYDEVKKKYFRIMPNHARQPNVVTNDSIRNQNNLEKVVKIRANCENIIKTLYTNTQSGLCDKFMLNKNNYNLFNLKCCSKVTLEPSRDWIKDISVFKFCNDSEFSYVLLNSIPSNYDNTHIVRLIQINRNKVDFGSSYSKVLFNLSRPPYRRFITDNVISHSLAYVHDNRYLVSDADTTFTNQLGDYNYRLYIDELVDSTEKNELDHDYDRIVDCKRLVNFPYTQLTLCSSLNSSMSHKRPLTKFGIGLENCAKVIDIMNCGNKVHLNTLSSNVFCQRFHPIDNEHLIYNCCKNKFILGYDLRQNTKNYASFTCKLEHKSCVTDLKFHSKNANYCFSTDYSGSIYLWDLRTNKHIYEYTENFNQNTSLKINLSECSNYLYTVGQDGHTRFWNLKTNKLVRTILTAKPMTGHEIYAEKPAVYLFDNLDMLYLLRNEMMLYSV